jgi:two-component system, cell cycle sensor histidine kinase and response regulator CckA
VTPSRGPHQGPYIIVADEDPQLLDLMVRTLRDAGYCVFQAYNGRAAYDLSLHLKTVDLLIPNTRMPGLQGPELIRYVRERLPALPILYVRNHGQPATPPDDLPADVPTLAEPFTERQLVDAVGQLLASG